MPKVIKVVNKTNETKPLPHKDVSGDVVIGYTFCFNCGKKSTIMSNKGHAFCDLACQTAAGE